MKTNYANWPAPENITALSTTRLDGFSQAPWDSNNLALHVGDNDLHVTKNRHQVSEFLRLPNEPVWLDQTHSTRCIIADLEDSRNADAAISHSSKHPLVVLTADCLPITLCSRQGDEIAAIHAGWRGLADGIIENTLDKMSNPSQNLMAWIGPAICGQCYETGDELYQAFTRKHPQTRSLFKANGAKWMADLPRMAELILNLQGIEAVYQSGLCTFELTDELFSFRRDSQTGRIATLIWFNNTLQDS